MHMNRIATILSVIMACLPVYVSIAASTYTYSVGLDSPKFVEPDGMVRRLGGVEWACAYERGPQFTMFHCYAPSDDGDADWGYEFGSTSNNLSRLSLSSADFAGRITCVSVISASDEGSAYVLSVSVGGKEFRRISAQRISDFKYNRWKYVYEGDARGLLTIEWRNSTGCYRLNELNVVTADDAGMCTAPVVQPDGGVITTQTAISMDCDVPGAVIRYTVDGSRPDAGAIVYDGAFTLPLGNAREVRAVASADGFMSSDVVSRTFDVVPHPGERGSESRPFNVDAACLLSRQCKSATVWVKGYVVGSVGADSVAVFGASGLSASGDVILAEEPYVTDLGSCVVVRRRGASVPLAVSPSGYKMLAHVRGMLLSDATAVSLIAVDRFGLPSDSGVAAVCDDAVQPEYFTLTGMKVDVRELIPGVYIRRRGASVDKIVVR